MKKEKYIITKNTLELVIEALSQCWFSEDGEYNNREVIDAQNLLESEIEDQDEVEI
jgi:hypothetical protein